MKEYQDRSVEDVAKEFGVDEKQLKEIERAADQIQGNINGLLPPSLQSGNIKEMLIKRAILEEYYVWGQVRPFILNGWTLKGFLGHIWLHGGILHLLGNMLFLWIFGNAVCAKLGNFKYLPIYIGLGFIPVSSQLIHIVFQLKHLAWMWHPESPPSTFQRILLRELQYTLAEH